MSHLVNDEADTGLLDFTERKNNQINCDVYYRRIVKNIFEESRFHYDELTRDYIANVPLRLSKEQWELLVNHDVNGLNLNEIDNLLDEILKQSKEDTVAKVSQILFEHYRQKISDLLPTFTSPGVLIAVAVAVIFLFNRSFRLSRLTYSAMILIVFFSICTISYLMTFWDCQHELEVEQMIQLSKRSSPNNPCKDYDGEQEGIWTSMKAMVFGSAENQCLEHMRKTFKQSKNYCDPLDVFAKWFAKIQMTYFNSVIGSFLEAVTKLSASSNFFTQIAVMVVAAACFGFFVVAMGKVAVKQGFKSVFNVLTTSRVSPTASNEAIDFNALHSKMDEILYENRQMKRELSAIRECSVERSIVFDNPPQLKIQDKPRLDDIDEELSPSSKEDAHSRTHPH
jgi:hypothetical protein